MDFPPTFFLPLAKGPSPYYNEIVLAFVFPFCPPWVLSLSLKGPCASRLLHTRCNPGTIHSQRKNGQFVHSHHHQGLSAMENSSRFPRLPSLTTKLACGQMYNQHISICLGCEPSAASIVVFGKPVSCFVLRSTSLHLDCLLCRTLYS